MQEIIYAVKLQHFNAKLNTRKGNNAYYREL